MIGKTAGNITNLKITNRSIDFFEMIVDVEVSDVRHLTNIIAGAVHAATIRPCMVELPVHERASRGWRRRRRHAGPARAAMILGIGNDIIDIRRIEKSLERFGDRFLQRVFTDVEQRKSDRRAQPRRQLRQALRGQGGLLQGAGHRPQPWRVLARHGRGQPADRQADAGADRRRR